MKLAIIRQRYNPYGGAERFVERALATLARPDLGVTLITREWSGDQGNFSRLICNPMYFGRAWRDASFARAACRAVNEGAFDLVQSHEKVPCCDIYRAGDGVHHAWLERQASALGRGMRLPVQLSAFNKYTLAAEDALYRSSRLRAIICISHLVKRDIEQWYGIASDRLHVIYNGIDLESFNPDVKASRDATRQRCGIPLDVPLFLFVGSGYERKGLGRLLRALPRDAWLLVVGKDKKQARYEHLASTLGVTSRVRFLGPQNNVKPFYGAADAFAFPTIYEPFGNVVLEAMACGLPVVTTPDCGGAELIVEGANGYVLDGSDEGAWLDALRKLLDIACAAKLGAAAARTASDYGLAKMGSSMVALYANLLK